MESLALVTFAARATSASDERERTDPQFAGDLCRKLADRIRSAALREQVRGYPQRVWDRLFGSSRRFGWKGRPARGEARRASDYWCATTLRTKRVSR